MADEFRHVDRKWKNFVWFSAYTITKTMADNSNADDDMFIVRSSIRTRGNIFCYVSKHQ